MSQPVNIAVTSWAPGNTGLAHDYAAQAKIAEAMGLHSYWLPESHFSGARSIPSPLMLLAAAATTTNTIGLGSTSYLLPIRHPLQAAEEVAVLDQISGGRVILGIGRGVQETMFHAFDVSPGEKRKRFKRNLDIMIRAWRGEPVLDGNEEAILAPLPIQSPHPPIWVAAFGPLAIKQAGSLGLPYLASPVETLAQLTRNYARHKQFVRDSGLETVETVPVMRTIYLNNNRREIAAAKVALNSAVRPGMRELDAEVDDWTIVGDSGYVEDRLSEYCERLGVTHFIARGRIPGVEDKAWIASLEKLNGIAANIRQSASRQS